MGGFDMKRSLIILAVFAAFAACSKEPAAINEEIDIQEKEPLQFIASTDAALTKTTLSDLGGGEYDIVWQTSDQIRLTDGTNNAVYKPTTAAVQSPLSKYSGTEPVGPTFYAYYPAAYHNVSTGVFSLPENWSLYSPGSFTGFPMYAQSNNTNLQFKNVCGLLELHLSGSGDDKIGRLVLKADQDLSGPMTIVADGGAYKAEITSGNKRVVVPFNSYKTLTEGVVVRLPLPAGTYTGLTIEVFPNPIGDHYSRKIANKGIVIVRSQITTITLTSIAFNITALTKGSGTSVDPYQIESEDDIIALGNDCRNGVSFTGKYLKVMNDINLTAPHKPFPLICAEFDGNDKTITLSSGFDLSANEQKVGFVSQLTGEIKNLTIAGPDITISASEATNMTSFGTFVGTSGTLRGCHNSINVTWTSDISSSVSMGGLSGNSSRVYNSTNNGNITLTLNNSSIQTSFMGGILGAGSTVSGCTNGGTIYGDGVRYTGGIAGGTESNYNTITIDRCSNAGAVTGIYKNSNINYCVGMAAGIIAIGAVGTITNCSNTAAIIAQKDNYGYKGPIVLAGGIIGKAAFSRQSYVTITNCYNTANIIARTEFDSYTYKPFAAGISAYGGTVMNCYTGGYIYTKAKSGGSYDNKSYGGAMIGFARADDAPNPNWGVAGNCYLPSQTLGGASGQMRTIGWVSTVGDENSTTTVKGDGTGGLYIDKTTLVSLYDKTIGETVYPTGTNLLTLLNAGVTYYGGDLLTWKAGTGEPAYPVFNE